MMSGAEQDQIQSMVDTASREERQLLRLEAESELNQIRMLAGSKILSAAESKQGEIAIEMLTRLDTTENSKGFLYRTKRRMELTAMYFG